LKRFSAQQEKYKPFKTLRTIKHEVDLDTSESEVQEIPEERDEHTPMY